METGSTDFPVWSLGIIVSRAIPTSRFWFSDAYVISPGNKGDLETLVVFLILINLNFEIARAKFVVTFVLGQVLLWLLYL